MIKPGRMRSAGEIVRRLRELQGMARAGLLMTARDTFLIGDAADMIERMERRIEDLEERIDILTAELPGAGCDIVYLLRHRDRGGVNRAERGGDVPGVRGADMDG